MSFAGHRGDHYDITPTTPQDMEIMRRANSGLLNWVAIPIAIEVTPGRWVAAGLNTVMHGSRMGGGNPGPEFPSMSNTAPPSGQPWPKGGHCCCYLSNSVGGAGNADSTNRHARAEANQLANSPRANGRQARAACHEAFFRSGGVQAVPHPVTVNYQVEVISGPVNIRKGAGTNYDAVEQVRNPRRFRIDQELIGTDGGTTSLWGRITDDEDFTGRWIALRLTNRVADAPVSPTQPPKAESKDRYVVVSGDTLIRIGNKTDRRWQEIADLNGVSHPYTIYVGQVLILP